MKHESEQSLGHQAAPRGEVASPAPLAGQSAPAGRELPVRPLEDKRATVNFCSGGRNSNVEPTCCAPRCSYLTSRTSGSGGWCQHPNNRVPPSDGWPIGFTPSVSYSGGCDLHPARAQEQS